MLAENPDRPPGLFVSNHLVNMYSECGDLGAARKVFDGMPDRNVVSWTALLSGYGGRGLGDECFCVFVDMLTDCRPNEFSFASVLGCCDYMQGKQVHGLALKLGLDGSVYVGKSLITLYSKMHGHEVSDGDEAWKVLLDEDVQRSFLEFDDFGVPEPNPAFRKQRKIHNHSE